MPMLDDPEGLLAVKGAGKLDGSVSFERSGGTLAHGHFDVDLAGTEFRLRHEYYPVTTAALSLDWEPQAARFTIENGDLAIGRSSAGVSGEVVLGLDDVYGSVLSTALTLKDLRLAPYDMEAPETPFTEVSVQAWSSPLYGALGLDKLVATKPGVEIRAKGRFDLLRSGIGVDLEMGGEGAERRRPQAALALFHRRGRTRLVRRTRHRRQDENRIAALQGAGRGDRSGSGGQAACRPKPAGSISLPRT